VSSAHGKVYRVGDKLIVSITIVQGKLAIAIVDMRSHSVVKLISPFKHVNVKVRLS
jgi:hypothetical protein